MWSSLAVASVVLVLLRLIFQVTYNIFFHPLRKFPGPLSQRAARLAYVLHARNGHFHKRLRDLHERYGPVVRIAPNELVFSDAAAWKDIYGHRIGVHGNQDENEKWIVWYAGTKNAPRSMLSAPRTEHASLRRMMSHGFSDRSLRAQESMIRSHVDLLVTQLREVGGAGADRVNIRDWISYTTFDIIGDLGFGASFDCLRKSDHRQWTQAFAGPGARVALDSTMRRMVLPDWLCDYIKKVTGGGQQNGTFQRYVRETVAARMEWTVQRPDLVEGLLLKEKEQAVPQQTVTLTAGLLLAAGFETTSSLVTATLYLLLRNPHCLEKVTHEVRSSFKSQDQISFAALDNLPYMIACLNEALRWYPPVANGLPREVMEGGTTIVGRHIPEGTIVSVPHWAAYHSSDNFVQPDKYYPERWLGDVKFASDNLEVVQPFMVGPRNCIGRNLATAEMRTILALLIYNFDFQMPASYIGWAENQKFFNLWDRGPLEMYVTPV